MLVWTLDRDMDEGNPALLGIFRSPQAAMMKASLDAEAIDRYRRERYLRNHGKRDPRPPFTPLVWRESPWGSATWGPVIWEAGDYTVWGRKVHAY